MSKLKLTDIDKVNKKIPFNTLASLEMVIDKSKMGMFTHKAGRVVVVAAKDTGKSFPVEAYKIYVMEKDPMASGITTMKYSTGASKRGARSFSSVLNALRRDFHFPNHYEKSTSFYYRSTKAGRGLDRDRMKMQINEFASFENADAFANYAVSNGGYIAYWHIEEPVLQNDDNVTPLEEWKTSYETIKDSVFRNYRAYLETNPYHEPVKPKIFITLNDWAPEHPVSKETEHYHPQDKFMNWILGFDYISSLKLWADKINGKDIVMPLKVIIDEKWEEIKERVLVNHTKWIYVEKNKHGELIDTLYGRMQKFANPSVRNNEEEKEKVYAKMYSALIRGDSYELARVFGLGYDGTGGDEKRFNFKSFIPSNTLTKLKEPGRKVLGFSVGWDHDANRGPVASPITFSAKWKRYDRLTNKGGFWYDPLIMVHPQKLMQGYGKGVMGENTSLYHKQMFNISKELLEQYVGNNDLEVGKFAVFDDDDGSYIGKIAKPLLEVGFNWADALPSKNGNIYTGGFGTVSRDDFWQAFVDLDLMLIDKENTLLIEWLKQVPRIQTEKGYKRSTKGKWGTRHKDVSNSAEYGWWAFIQPMIQMEADVV